MGYSVYLSAVLARTFVVCIPPVVEFLEGISFLARIPVDLSLALFLLECARFVAVGVSRSARSTV